MNDYDTALKRLNHFEGALKEHGVRMTNDDKWLVWDDAHEEWIVYQWPRGAKKSLVLYRGTREELAISALIEDEPFTHDPSNDWTYITAEPDTLPDTLRAVDVSYDFFGVQYSFIAYYNKLSGKWYNVESGEEVQPSKVIYSWRERPEPAPYQEAIP